MGLGEERERERVTGRQKSMERREQKEDEPRRREHQRQQVVKLKAMQLVGSLLVGLAAKTQKSVWISQLRIDVYILWPIASATTQHRPLLPVQETRSKRTCRRSCQSGLSTARRHQSTKAPKPQRENSPTIGPHGKHPCPASSSTAPLPNAPQKRKRALSSVASIQRRMKRNCSKANQSPSLISLPTVPTFQNRIYSLLPCAAAAAAAPLFSNYTAIAKSTKLRLSPASYPSTVVFSRYLRHFTDRISLPPPTPGPRITHRIEHAGNRLPFVL